jgi:hypothetical protein
MLTKDRERTAGESHPCRHPAGDTTGDPTPHAPAADGGRFFTTFVCEKPLQPLEAFRLASFGIEYVPVLIPVRWDRDSYGSRLYHVKGSDFEMVYTNLLTTQNSRIRA